MYCVPARRRGLVRVKETMVFSMNHQVAPREETLRCDSCHSPKGVLDFKKLGYGEEKIKKLSGGY